jgi:adenylate cyclase
LTRAAASILAGLAVGAGAVAAGAGGALDRVEGDTIDLRFDVRGARPAPDVVVVAIDDVTFGELNQRWPFPRALHARAIDRLRAAGAGQIAYDVQFTEPTDERNDNALFEAVARGGHVVLSTTEVARGGRSNVLGGEANLRSIGARAASTNLPAAPGGVLRRLPYSIEGLTTLPVAARQAAGQHGIHPSAFGAHGAWIDYAGPPGTIKSVSFSRVVQGKVDPAVFRGKTVVVGATAPSLQDVHPSPTSGSQLMPGPEIQANAISTVERGLPLRQVPFALDAVLTLLLALAAPLAALRVRARWAALAALGLLALYLAVTQLLFNGGTIVAVVSPAIAAVLGTAAMIASALLAESRERQRTRALFARFVPEAVVGELLDRTGGEARLGGVEMEATVMFCDLRGFTSFAEPLPAARVIEALNRYLTQMSEAILDHGGTLVAYMGDGIMAVFGSPLERPDHADSALACAREMLGPRLGSFNAWLRSEYDAVSLRMGVGLNSGTVMSGNVGSERRLEYTAIGDTTNVAARLEAQTKQAGCALLLSDATRRALTRPSDVELVDLGPITLRGREEAIVMWTLAETAPGRDEDYPRPAAAPAPAGAAT